MIREGLMRVVRDTLPMESKHSCGFAGDGKGLNSSAQPNVREASHGARYAPLAPVRNIVGGCVDFFFKHIKPFPSAGKQALMRRLAGRVVRETLPDPSHSARLACDTPRPHGTPDPLRVLPSGAAMRVIRAPRVRQWEAEGKVNHGVNPPPSIAATYEDMPAL